MDRRSFAVLTVLLGLLVGWLGNVLFYGKLIGLSAPLFTLIFLGALFIAGRAFHFSWRLRNLWPLIPLIFFASMVAVRADPFIVMLDILAALALVGLTLHYLPLEYPLDVEPLEHYARGTLEAGLSVPRAARAEIADSAVWLKERRVEDHARWIAVGRGALFALPVVVVFGVLLGSADPVFGSYVSHVFDLFHLQNSGDFILQTLLTLALGWLACGALAYGLARRPKVPRQRPVRQTTLVVGETSTTTSEPLLPDFQAAEQPKKRPITLGMIESLMILGSVDGLFGAFVVVQFAYFFGGRTNISVAGLTYSDYARRGFFELLAVSVMTLALGLALNRITLRYGQRQERTFRILTVILVGLTGVLLVSAAQRMWRYEQAYGFTQQRVYTHVFMVWLGLLFAAFLLALFGLREQIFSLGTLLMMVGYLGTLNVMNVDGYIAAQNIARFRDGHELDTCYLYTLSLDAYPEIMSFYSSSRNDDPSGTLSAEIAREIEYDAIRLDGLEKSRASTVFSANLTRDQVWTTLKGLREQMSADEARNRQAVTCASYLGQPVSAAIRTPNIGVFENSYDAYSSTSKTPTYPLNMGDEVTVLAITGRYAALVRTADGNYGWTLVSWLNLPGSLASQYSPNPQVTPYARTTPSYVVATPSPAYSDVRNPVVKVERAEIYNYPGGGYVIGSLTRGVRVLPLALSRDGRYVEIRMMDGQIGWIRADALAFSSALPLSVLPTATPAS